MAFIHKNSVAKPKHKNKGGRPKKYTDEFINNEADALENYLYESMANELLLKLETFCLNRGYTTDLISQWAKINKKFSKVLKTVKKFQVEQIVNGAITNKLNPTFSMFLLKCQYGFNDGNVRKIEVSGKDGQAIKTENNNTTKVKKELVDEDSRTAEILKLLRDTGELDSWAEEKEPAGTEIN